MRSRRRVQLLERGRVLFPGGIVVDGKHAGVVAGLEDGARHQRCGRDVHVVGDASGAPDDARRRRSVQCAPMVALPATPTQPAIAVCLPMRTLWPIWIRLSSLTPSSITVSSQRAAVDAGVGADLDVVADAHRAELLDLDPGALVRREAEAVGADHHAGMQQAARADDAVLAHGHARLEHGAGADARAALDHAQRADARRGIDHCLRIDHGAGMDARALRPGVGALPELGQARRSTGRGRA